MSENDVNSVASDRWAHYERLYQAGSTIILGSVLLWVASDRFNVLWPIVVSAQYLCDLLSFVLLGFIIVLILRYMMAVSGEMRMLRRHLEELIPPTQAASTIWALMFAFLLATLAYFYKNIIIFSSLFTLFSVGDMWGQSIRDRNLKEVLSDVTTKEISEDKAKALKVIEHYYLGRPQIPRAATVMFFSFVALLLAVIGHLAPQPALRPWLCAAAHFVILINIFISEWVILRWRKERNKDIPGPWGI